MRSVNAVSTVSNTCPGRSSAGAAEGKLAHFDGAVNDGVPSPFGCIAIMQSSATSGKARLIGARNDRRERTESKQENEQNCERRPPHPFHHKSNANSAHWGTTQYNRVEIGGHLSSRRENFQWQQSPRAGRKHLPAASRQQKRARPQKRSPRVSTRLRRAKTLKPRCASSSVAN
jgi:hypothetical protein